MSIGGADLVRVRAGEEANSSGFPDARARQLERGIQGLWFTRERGGSPGKELCF